MNICIIVCTGICVVSTIFQILLLDSLTAWVMSDEKFADMIVESNKRNMGHNERNMELNKLTIESNKRNMDSNDKVINMLEKICEENEQEQRRNPQA